MTALTDAVKDKIQTAYRTWLAARDFKPRSGQRQMIAQIARSLSAKSDRVAVVEAGTGTGKTAAYCLAAIPVAQSLNKTIVLSTATVALQEQVILQDLPDIQQRAGLKFSLTLAKGRGRYLCLKRLDDHLKYKTSRKYRYLMRQMKTLCCTECSTVFRKGSGMAKSTAGRRECPIRRGPASPRITEAAATTVVLF